MKSLYWKSKTESQIFTHMNLLKAELLKKTSENFKKIVKHESHQKQNRLPAPCRTLSSLPPVVLRAVGTMCGLKFLAALIST